MSLHAFQNHIQIMELVDTPSLKAFEDVVVDRQVAGFDPSFWGDYFITNQKSQSEAWMNERAEELKNEVRSMFQNVTGILQTMNLIDTIQLLGLDYHFMEAIAKALDHLKDVDMSKYGLYEVALHFRLLRQKGFNISSDLGLTIFLQSKEQPKADEQVRGAHELEAPRAKAAEHH
ncbi:(S)-beta-bisabolene synthase-like [Zingiber officinale]|uniref:(S)-beta-bisabolene synthase-like n=1 Tax=Zingiber officinale TaxID=94328 RepID=UPI001C4B1105|nr:(S)-beta-bisabolene synthase-like [Zingiber officinale]